MFELVFRLAAMLGCVDLLVDIIVASFLMYNMDGSTVCIELLVSVN